MTKTLVKATEKTLRQKSPKSHTKDITIKYDSVWLNKELNKQIELLRTKEQITTKIQLYRDLDYTKNKFDYWMRKNGNKPHTQELAKKIDEVLEARLIEHGLQAKNPAFTIFLLKNNYGYTDNRTVTNEGTVVFTVTRGQLTPAKRKQISAQQQ